MTESDDLALFDVLVDGVAILLTIGVGGRRGAADPQGLSHKEVAVLRGISDATVRQQAESIYRKADLAAGRLVRPCGLGIRTDYSYRVASPEALFDQPKVVAFREWLRAETAASECEAEHAGPRDRERRGRRLPIDRARDDEALGPPVIL